MSTSKTPVCDAEEMADQYGGGEAAGGEIEGGREAGGSGGYISYPSHCRGALLRGRGGMGGEGKGVGGQRPRVSFPWSSSDLDSVGYSTDHDDVINASFPVEPGRCHQLF